MLYKKGSAEQLRKTAALCQACLDFDGAEALGEITRPMLVLGAEDDPVFPWEPCSRELAEGLGCEFFLYPGYRHGVYDEAPDYKDRIAAFFAR